MEKIEVKLTSYRDYISPSHSNGSSIRIHGRIWPSDADRLDFVVKWDGLSCLEDCNIIQYLSVIVIRVNCSSAKVYPETFGTFAEICNGVEEFSRLLLALSVK